MSLLRVIVTWGCVGRGFFVGRILGVEHAGVGVADMFFDHEEEVCDFIVIVSTLGACPAGKALEDVPALLAFVEWFELVSFCDDQGHDEHRWNKNEVDKRACERCDDGGKHQADAEGDGD